MFIQLKDIKDIEFNIQRISEFFDGKDRFILADDAKIKNVGMKRNKLKEFFKPYQKNMSEFKFDREEANER